MASMSTDQAPSSRKKRAAASTNSAVEFTTEREITQENPQVQDIDVKVKSTNTK